MAGDLIYDNVETRYGWEFTRFKRPKKLRRQIYSILNTEIRYEWQFNPCKIPKQGRTGNLFHRTGKNKVQLGIYFFENAEIMYRLLFIFIFIFL